MFFLSLATLTLATSALATPLKRADGLAIELKVAEAKVASIEDITVTATVTNTGSEDVRILKYGTVLDKLPTKSFIVTKDGAEVAFTGIRMQVDISETNSDAYAVIPAGQSISVTHNVAETYDFESAGVGAFTFAPVTNIPLSAAASKANAVESYSRVEVPSGSTATVEVTQDVAARGIGKRSNFEERSNEKRATVTCSNASRLSFMQAAYSEGKSLSSQAATWLNANPSASLKTAYWKTNSASTVASRFTTTANENSSARSLSCNDAGGYCSGGVIAYTFTASPQNMVVCSIFFNEVPSTSLCSGTTVASRNVRGGTILHEITHAVVGTTDVTYGCSADQGLSASQQLSNADNYNCFATQVYQNTRC